MTELSSPKSARPVDEEFSARVPVRLSSSPHVGLGNPTPRNRHLLRRIPASLPWHFVIFSGTCPRRPTDARRDHGPPRTQQRGPARGIRKCRPRGPGLALGGLPHAERVREERQTPPQGIVHTALGRCSTIDSFRHNCLFPQDSIDPSLLNGKEWDWEAKIHRNVSLQKYLESSVAIREWKVGPLR